MLLKCRKLSQIRDEEQVIYIPWVEKTRFRKQDLSK